MRVWRAEHPEGYALQNAASREASLAYYHAHIEEQRAANAAYNARERERCTERERLRQDKTKPGHPQFVERVDRHIVYERHNGVCGICGRPVSSDAFEIDHRVPLSRGGLHGYENCQPAHARCNQRKNTKLEEEIVSA